MLRFRNLVLLALCSLLLLTGCQKKPASTADVPRVLSPRYSIAVVPFSQPTEACNLIMGHLPENQGCIPANQLMQLDNELRTLLTGRESVRSVSFEKTLPAFLAASTSFRATSEPQALPGWAKFAKKTGKDFTAWIPDRLVAIEEIVKEVDANGGPGAGNGRLQSIIAAVDKMESSRGNVPGLGRVQNRCERSE